MLAHDVGLSTDEEVLMTRLVRRATVVAAGALSMSHGSATAAKLVGSPHDGLPVRVAHEVRGASERKVTMQEQTDPVGSYEIRADLVCVLCTRTVGRVQGADLQPLTPVSLRVPEAQHADTVRRLRCPYCAGRLWVQNSEEIYVNRRPLTPEELRPRRGRPPKMRTAS